MFMRPGTPSGLRIMSTGVLIFQEVACPPPERFLEMTPSLPWRPAISVAFVRRRRCATLTRTIFYARGQVTMLIMIKYLDVDHLAAPLS